MRGVGDVTRLFTMSVSDLLNDWFESDAAAGDATVNGVIGTRAGPDFGTAYVMLHHSIGDVGDGHRLMGISAGRHGAVSAACRRSAESFGAEIRTNASGQDPCRVGAPLGRTRRTARSFAPRSSS